MRKIILFFIALMALNATTPTYENVTRLYVAIYERTPDVVGLKYWVNDSGLSLEEIAKSFFEQSETQAKLVPNDYEFDWLEELTQDRMIIDKVTRALIKAELIKFIENVYLNLFDRAPDTVGQTYWSNELLDKKIPPSTFTLAVINGAQGSDAAILADKTNDAYNEIKDDLPDEPSDPTGCHSRGSGSFTVGTGRLTYECIYYGSGQLKQEIPRVDGKVHGTARAYYEQSGSISAKIDYWNGLKNGKCIAYYDYRELDRNSGKMYSCDLYEDDKKIGSCM